MLHQLRIRVAGFAALVLVLVTGMANVGMASPPGDNGQIVYTTDAGLYTAEPDGSGSALVVAATDPGLPDVTADGSWALFVTDVSSGTGALVVVDLATGVDTTVVSDGVSGAAWSGDGTRIAYSQNGVRVADFVAGTPPALANEQLIYAEGNQVFDWSAVDARVLVARVVMGSFPEYYVETIDADTLVVAPVADNGPGLFTWYLKEADFSPDGAEIAYVAASPGVILAYVSNDDGSGEHEIAGVEGAWHQGPAGPIAWAPDGTSVGVLTMLAPLEDPSISLRDPATGAAVGEIPLNVTGFDWAPMAAVPPPPPPPGGGTFTDVPTDHVFAEDIEWLAAAGVTKGCNPPTNDMFCPEATVTRGQMAAFLVRALGYTDDGGGDLFVDDDDSVFEGDIDKLAAADVTKGCNPPTNDMFCPDAPLTREQMAAFLVRALGYSDDGGGNLFLDDDDSIFENDIDKLATAGVTLGCNPPDNTNFCPEALVTRGQMAAFLHRALGD